MSEEEDEPVEERSSARNLGGGLLGDLLSGCAFEGCLTLAAPSLVVVLSLPNSAVR